ncbi:MAG: hypothetical protein P1P86_10275 [Bacteroidales bacterium]|nr:hypothetical protein [Bacteroidales bacterium]
MKAAKTKRILMMMFFFAITSVLVAQEEIATTGNSELQVVCSPQLESLAKQLTNDYMKENQEIRIEVRAIPGTEVRGALKEEVLRW